jgi:hypothetical protein
MSDYLTRLVERSLGLAPRIEPLIAPIHAPSDQALRTSADTPATTETSQQDAPPDVAANARGVRPVPSHTESQSPGLSSPLPASQAEFPIQKKDGRSHPGASKPRAPSHPASSDPRVEAVDTIAATSSHLSPLSNAKLILSQGTAQTALHQEPISPLEPTASLLAPARESAPTEPRLLPRTTITVSERMTQAVVHPEIISPLKSEASPVVPAPESSATEPERTTQAVVHPEIISPLKPSAPPFVPVGQSSSNEPPAIHITIGRVEVRAVVPHMAKPKVESPAARKLSLEDYLKQRNGGRS